MFNNFCKIFIKDSEDVKSPKVREKYGTLSSVFGIILNVLLFGIKLLAGVLSGSVAIVADAINNLTDASTNIIGFLAFKLGSRPADKDHPYGHGRYEYIASLTVSILVMLIGFELLKSGVEEIITPKTLIFSYVMVGILIASIIIKFIMMLFNSEISKKINSDVLKATATDSRNDVIATSAVLLSLIISHLTSVNLDGYMTVLVALFIMFSGFNLIKDTLGPILGKAPDKELVDGLKEKILSYEGVLGIHDLLVHDYGVGRQFASVHAEMSAEEDPIKSHETLDTIEMDVLKELNVHLVVHYDPISTENEEINELRRYIEKTVVEIDKTLSVHDVRVVYGIDRNIAIFDMVVPFSCTTDDKILKEQITLKIKEKYPSFDTNITIDKSYE